MTMDANTQFMEALGTLETLETPLGRVCPVSRGLRVG